MKKFLINLSLIIVLMFGSCLEDYGQADWSINTIELAEKYFPRYFEYARGVIDEYDMEYQLESKRRDDEDLSLRFWDKFTFNANLRLLLITDYVIRSPETSSYSLSLWYTFSEKENIADFPNDFFEMMDRINRFCVYDLHGDESTYKNLFSQACMEFQKEGSGWAEYSYSPLDWVKYQVRIYRFEESEHYMAEFELGAMLTDKNILNIE